MDAVAIVLCQNCLTAYEVLQSKLGQRARCPRCGSVFALESAPEGVTATETLELSTIVTPPARPGPVSQAPQRQPREVAQGQAGKSEVVERRPDTPRVEQVPPRKALSPAVLAAVVLSILCLGLGFALIYVARSKTDSNALAPGAPVAPTTEPATALHGASQGGVVAKPVSEITVDGEVFIVTKGGQSIKLGLVEIGLIQMELLEPRIQQRRAEINQALAQLDPQIKAAEEKEERLREDHERLSKIEHEASDRFLHPAPGKYTDAAEHAAARKAEQESFRVWLASSEEVGTLRRQRNELFSARTYFALTPTPARVTKTNSDGKFHVVVPKTGLFAIAATASRLVGDGRESYHWLLKVDPAAGASQTLLLSNDNMTSSGAPESLIHAAD